MGDESGTHMVPVLAVERLLEYMELLSDMGRRQGPGELKSFRFRTFAELLLVHGRLWWEQVDLDRAGITRGVERRCWQNSTELADQDPALVYVEGFASCSVLPVGTEHAWCVSRHGDMSGAIDVTWRPDQHVAYLGLPLSDEIRAKAQETTNRWQVLTGHNSFGVALLRDGPDPDTLVDVGVPVAAVRPPRS
ncbi:hypothetical protein ABT324_02710 [Saccharopolyspora sp. NPDC000359]|uniref:hypothetical protein n=1 Tax=Saccharopolyspora sp. NPDC000359 TaxID=3154251 RepID=UPI003334A499